MLTLDPKKRITVSEALQHEYFKKEPLDEKLALGDAMHMHDFEMRLRRNIAKKHETR